MNQNDEYEYRKINNILDNLNMDITTYFFERYDLLSKKLETAMEISNKISMLQDDIRIIIEEGKIERESGN